MKKSIAAILPLLMMFFSPRFAGAQDIHYSHITFSPLYTNPAFTGYFNGNMRFYANYRNQFLTLLGKSAFQTYSGSADFNMPVGVFGKDFVGAGLFAFNDKVGKAEDGGQISTTSVGLSGSYSKALAQDGKHAITIGLMGLFMQRRFVGDDLLFGSQYNELTGEVFPTPPPDEFVPGTELNYINFDFTLGLLYLGKISKKMVLYTGLSVAHLIQPKWSFLDDDDPRLPIRYGGQVGMNIDINKRLDVAPFVFYQHQGKIGELVLGNLVDYRIVEYKGAETDLLVGTYLRTLSNPVKSFSFESMIILLGIDYTDLRVAFSYDAQFGGLRDVAKSNSAFEVSIRYTMAFIKAKPVSRFCPRF